ncbi:MAG: hypothetical protein REJ23_04350 [Brevundimonas sp.]|nr:hypothetical protein [Brevundimonas sp.]
MKWLLAALVALLVSGCSMHSRYVDAPGWASYDPEVYSVEYANAVSRAVVSTLSGMDYETFMGDRLFDLAQTREDRTFCDVDRLSRFISGGFGHCKIAQAYRTGTPECLNKVRCAAIRLNPEVVEHFQLKPLIEDVLTNPCAYAIKPDAYREKPNAVVRHGWPPAPVWSQLWLCNSEQPLRGIVAPYAGDGIFRVSFE